MLIDILKMPPVLGVPIHRQYTIHPNSAISNTIVNHTGLTLNTLFHHKQLLVGSVISEAPRNLFKLVHATLDNMLMFETVFAMEAHGFICLYSKIISDCDVSMALSVKAIQAYRDLRTEPFPLSYLIDIEPRSFNIVTSRLVPPVFGEAKLKSHLYRLLDVRVEGFVESYLGFVYKPLYHYEPTLMDALIEGQFRHSPFIETPRYHPSIDIPKNKWFKYEELGFAQTARGMEAHSNHPSFDAVALKIVSIPFSDFNVTCTMEQAFDGINQLYQVRDFCDHYHRYLRGMNFNIHTFREYFTDVFYQSALLYCEIYGINKTTFLNSPFDKSSVTISKNIYDEIVVTFHDIIHERYVSFYSSFPALALATLSVGEYQ